MNAFRLLFLIIVLAGSLAVALARMAPGVVADQSRDALAERARLESILVDQMERTARLERGSAAQRVAASPQLGESLSPSGGAPTGTPRAMFSQASNSIRGDAHLSTDALILVGADGAVVHSFNTVSTIDDSAFADEARAVQAIASGELVTTYFGHTGRMFASAAAPVSNSVGNNVGAVVLIQEYDTPLVASRRSGPGANTAYFVGSSIVASNIADPEVTEHAERVVSRTRASTLGTPGRLLQQQLEPVGDREVMIAPVRIADPQTEQKDDAAELGVVVVVESLQVPGNLPAVLARFRAFDDGTSQIWMIMALGLILFFLGLVLLDSALIRAMKDLGRRIRENATNNDPELVPVDKYLAWIRPVAEAYNVFLEAYRHHSPTARRARGDSSAHLFMVDTSSPGRPVVMSHDHVSASASDVSSAPMSPASSSGSSTAVFTDVDAVPADFIDPEEPGLLRLDTGQHVSLSDSVPTPGGEGGVSQPQPASAEPAAFDADPPASALEPGSDPMPRATPFLSGSQPDAAGQDSRATMEAPTVPPDAFDEPEDPVEQNEMLMDALADAAAFVESLGSGSRPQVEGDPVPDGAPEGGDDWSALLDEVERSTSGSQQSARESGSKPSASPHTQSGSPAAVASIQSERSESASAESGSPAPATPAPATPAPATPAPATPAPATPAPATPAAGGSESGSAALEGAAGPAIGRSAVDEGPRRDAPAGPGTPAVKHTMIGVGLNFEADEPDPAAGGFQRLRSSSTPAGVAAVTEAGLLDSSGFGAALDALSGPSKPTAPVESAAPPPAPPAPPAPPNPMETESDAAEQVPTQDPQQDRTVPRVSVDEVVSRDGGKPPADQEALMAAAEERMRALAKSSDGNDDAGLDPKHRGLFEEFVAAKQQCGEDTARLTYARFVAKLDRNRAALKARYTCSDVRFEVSIRNDKVTLKATPIR